MSRSERPRKSDGPEPGGANLFGLSTKLDGVETVKKRPSPNGSNGRAENGRFASGNAGGPGNPHAKRVAELRSALLGKINHQDITEIVAMLLKKAKKGDIAAAKEVLDRALGKVTQPLTTTLQGERSNSNEEGIPQLVWAYAKAGVPKQAWPAMASGWYDRWCAGEVRYRPADFEALRQTVQSRCIGWEKSANKESSAQRQLPSLSVTEDT